MDSAKRNIIGIDKTTPIRGDHLENAADHFNTKGHAASKTSAREDIQPRHLIGMAFTSLARQALCTSSRIARSYRVSNSSRKLIGVKSPRCQHHSRRCWKRPRFKDA